MTNSHNTVGMRLYDDNGHRLYINSEERAALIQAASTAPREVKCFAHILIYAGARISEALALTYGRIDLADHAIRIRSLKKRKDKHGQPRIIYRSVPVPPALIDMLDMVYGIREIQARGKAAELEAQLFPIGRTKAWQNIKNLMEAANIPDGPHRTPKGLRHSFGVNAIANGVQLNMLQKWMGHADIKTTAIYANAVGQEERDIASRMWG